MCSTACCADLGDDEEEEEQRAGLTVAVQLDAIHAVPQGPVLSGPNHVGDVGLTQISPLVRQVTEGLCDVDTILYHLHGFVFTGTRKRNGKNLKC